MSKLIAASAVVVWLIATSTTQAATFNVAQQLPIAIQAGEQYWGQVPCNGHSSWQLSEVGFVSSNTVMQTDMISCTTTIRVSYYEQLALQQNAWPQFCTGVVHEMGHQLGFQEQPGYHAPDGTFNSNHSNDPRNVMYPSFTYLNEPMQCKSAEVQPIVKAVVVKKVKKHHHRHH